MSGPGATFGMLGRAGAAGAADAGGAAAGASPGAAIAAAGKAIVAAASAVAAKRFSCIEFLGWRTRPRRPPDALLRRAALRQSLGLDPATRSHSGFREQRSRAPVRSGAP